MSFGGIGDSLVQSAKRGCGFEAEFGDEARSVGFVVLEGRHFAVPNSVTLVM